MRAYRLAASPFNMAPSTQEEQAAVTLDWLLRIDDAVLARRKADAEKKAKSR